MSSKPREIRCPACGRFTVYSPDNPYRPFCSARCKQIDLGAWASEQYRVAAVDDDADPNSTIETKQE